MNAAAPIQTQDDAIALQPPLPGSDALLVFVMRTDPEPIDTSFLFQAEYTVSFAAVAAIQRSLRRPFTDPKRAGTKLALV
jgi:hypothetical protein